MAVRGFKSLPYERWALLKLLRGGSVTTINECFADARRKHGPMFRMDVDPINSPTICFTNPTEFLRVARHGTNWSTPRGSVVTLWVFNSYFDKYFPKLLPKLMNTLPLPIPCASADVAARTSVSSFVSSSLILNRGPSWRHTRHTAQHALSGASGAASYLPELNHQLDLLEARDDLLKRPEEDVISWLERLSTECITAVIFGAGAVPRGRFETLMQHAFKALHPIVDVVFSPFAKLAPNTSSEFRTMMRSLDAMFAIAYRNVVEVMTELMPREWQDEALAAQSAAAAHPKDEIRALYDGLDAADGGAKAASTRLFRKTMLAQQLVKVGLLPETVLHSDATPSAEEVEAMMERRRKAVGDLDGAGLNVTEVVLMNVMTLYLAGVDTTGTLMSWVLYDLARHPEQQERLRAQVKSVCKDGRLGACDLDKVPLATAAAKESARLHSIVLMSTRELDSDIVASAQPYGAYEDGEQGAKRMRRRLKKCPITGAVGGGAAADDAASSPSSPQATTKSDGEHGLSQPSVSAGESENAELYELPAGASICYAYRPNAMDARVFPEPEVYDISRWSSEQKALDFERDAVAASAKWSVISAAPFSFGPRQCIGRHLALAEMTLMLSRILCRYEVRLRDPSVICTEAPGLLFKPSPDPDFVFTKLPDEEAEHVSACSPSHVSGGGGAAAAAGAEKDSVVEAVAAAV